jgi:hypothetical protein
MISVEFWLQVDFALDLRDFNDCLKGRDGRNYVESVVVVLYDLSLIEIVKEKRLADME